MRPIAPSIRMMTVAAAATGAVTSALQQRPPQSRFIYKLGNSLYVPLTSRCNSLTLPQLRGESFFLPTPVVAALCRVRDAELRTKYQTGDVPWYYNGDGSGDDLPPKMKLPPPPFAAVASLPQPSVAGDDMVTEETFQTEREPGLDDLMREIRHEFRDASASSNQIIESIVIAGEGEPTLLLEDTFELVRRIRSFAETLPAYPGKNPPAIRLTTNGLVVPSIAQEEQPQQIAITTSGYGNLPQRLWDSGVSRISVGLLTWNAKQYDDMMEPILVHGTSQTGFDVVCNFIQEAVRVNGDLEVELTAIDRPDVDKAKTEALAESLGVRMPVRWRPYFP